MKQAELGQPIARGGVSELYAWPDGRVLKLFNRGWSIFIERYEKEYFASPPCAWRSIQGAASAAS